MNFAAQQQADALLDAHVAWVRGRLDGPGLPGEIESLVDLFLAIAAKLRLADVITADAVSQTAVGYAAHMKVGGAIPALVGDIAAAVYEHPVHEETRLEELLPDREFEEWLDKFLEMQSLRQALIHKSVSNPIFSSLASQLVYSGLADYLERSRRLVVRVPGARIMLKAGRAMMDRARPALGAEVERGIRRYVARSTGKRLIDSEHYLSRAFESDAFRQVVLDFWDDNKQRSVASVRDFAGQLDIEELFVIGYQYWLQLRERPIYSQLIEVGVEVFFDTYQDATLAELLDDIGVTRDMMVADGVRFLPRVLAALDERGLLEPAIRRQMEDFYRSDAVAAILRQPD